MRLVSVLTNFVVFNYRALLDERLCQLYLRVTS